MYIMCTRQEKIHRVCEFRIKKRKRKPIDGIDDNYLRRPRTFYEHTSYA